MRNMVITGGPGSGKTVAMQGMMATLGRTTLVCGEKTGTIPVFAGQAQALVLDECNRAVIDAGLPAVRTWADAGATIVLVEQSFANIPAALLEVVAAGPGFQHVRIGEPNRPLAELEQIPLTAPVAMWNRFFDYMKDKTVNTAVDRVLGEMAQAVDAMEVKPQERSVLRATVALLANAVSRNQGR